MSRILIRNGHLVDPANGIDRPGDLAIADGRVLAAGTPPDDFQADEIIDARDQIVCPGFIDLAARLGEPGTDYTGSIASETRAAASAGITTLCVPPDTSPVIDTPAVSELIHQKAEAAGFARVVTLGALTRQLDGEQLAEMARLQADGGCVGISNARRPVRNTLVMRRAMEYAASCGLTVFLQADDPGLSGQGCVHEGAISTRLGLPGIPESAETVAVARELMLIEQTGVRAHFGRLSCAHSVQMIARARHDGLPITMDVAAHQLHLTDMDVGHFDSRCHVLPPLRGQRDRDALRSAVASGGIGAICSDHQPRDADAKLAPFAETEPGISALETLLPLSLRLVDDGLLSLSDLIARLSSEPARILGLDRGHLGPGAPADVCIFDPRRHWRVQPGEFLSRGRNPPFDGWELRGRVSHTLLAGRCVHRGEP
ncbi:MAG TPA: dihydroorotase [Gammaproteobacteria bacterium]|nr:dihydroorotase [Gammaproteobacteria bacterium]